MEHPADTQTPSDAVDQVAASHDLPIERMKLTALLAANPNYFGTAGESDFPVVKAMSGNTSFEELGCVSFDPAQSLLQATLFVKRPFGYGGDLCQQGSREYVRFFLDYGAGWVDAGVASVEVHDIFAGLDCFEDSRFPLSYTATLKLDAERNWCRTPVLPTVRAILSWQVVPSDPDFVPVWGEVQQCHIQIAPRPTIVFDLVDTLSASLQQKVALPDDFAYAGPIELPGPGPAELALSVRATMYAASAGESGHEGAEEGAAVVPAHRFGFGEIAAAQASPAVGAELVGQNVAAWSAVGLDWIEAASAINEIAADVSWEQLECLGLDNNVDRLAATFRVKRPNGYNGGLCTKGSSEYVTFWADWTDDCKWTYVGTTAVAVHDISPLPTGGLCYAAVMKVDLTHQRRLCSTPRVVRVRAVLSWNTPPSAVDPDVLPTWGNRIDAHVQVRPGPFVPPGEATPLIGLLGGIPVSRISSVSGLTNPTAHFALLGGSAPADPDNLGRPCPFAARVALQGPMFPGYSYRVQVKKASDATWQTVNNQFEVVDETGLVFTTQIPTGEYFAYLPSPMNVDNVLAEWDTGGDELWDVKLDILGVAGSDTHRLQLHNSGPDAAIDIDVLAGNCGKFPVGTQLGGHFVARDEYLAHYTLGTSPFGAPVGALTPTTPAYVQTAPGPNGDNWLLDTTGMKPCGYVIGVSVVSRAIYNSSPSYTSNGASQGYCLEVPSA